MSVKVKIKDLAVGTEFNAGPATLRILEHFTDGTTLVITSGSIGDRPFNIFPFVYERPEGFNLNDWRTSTIRKDLNENFLAANKAAGKIDTDRIVMTEWDLSDHQGGAGYGTSQDKIGLLSQKQFEKYAEQDLLELDDWWWLITPYAGHSYYARFVDTDGSLSNNYACYGNFGVRPAFRLESEIEIVLEEDKVNLSDSVLLEGFTTRQLVEEVLRRIAEGTEGDEDDSDF
ncbi:DUF6273 domain-containing protein [Gudongella oleilytica]|uniref:DUF6273 domain-containing protein n=1 Tax=Gudongella oleilytica TaxID=1582259 RepID=UPI002A361B08|nr:DUF6273 domain-containing protein [Gudongella oleilytica]MDY0256233.1 DUF6273 domain-containing protein [Gudongella oleilytica]